MKSSSRSSAPSVASCSYSSKPARENEKQQPDDDSSDFYRNLVIGTALAVAAGVVIYRNFTKQ